MPSNVVLIAVLGVTGSGKSSFIRRVTGDENILIGDDLNSGTVQIQSYTVSDNGKTYVLVDTPGFDDGERTDEDIFESLAQWLRDSYRKGQRLSGLLYLHRITANREKGSDLRNLKVFKSLCGAENYDRIVLGVTWWDQTEPGVALAREAMLRDETEFWGDMIKAGTKVKRIPHNGVECKKLLQEFTENIPAPLLIQQEMARGKKLRDTTAAEQMADYKDMQAIKDAENIELKALDEIHRLRHQAIEERAWERRMEQRRRQREIEMQQSAQMQSLESVRRQMSQLSTRATASSSAHGQREQRIRVLTETLQRAKAQTQAPGYNALDAEKTRILRRSGMHIESIETELNKLSAAGEVNQYWRCIANPTNDVETDLCTSFCDRCMREASIRGYYACFKCILRETPEGSNSFLVCNQCKERGSHCLDRSHTLTPRPPIQAGFNDDIKELIKFCPRARHISNGLKCDECGRVPGPIFLHCCKCKVDDFDLCLDCYIAGETCFDSVKHTLFVHSWCPPSAFRRMDQIAAGA